MMDSLQNIFEQRNIDEDTLRKAPRYYWQEVALEVLQYIEEPKRAVVFKWAKRDHEKLKTSIQYMKDKNKRHFLYLAKLMNL